MDNWLERYRGILTAFLLLAIALGSVLWWERRPVGRELLVTAPNTPSPDRGSAITVDVAGAVAQPGIYSLPAGSRVADAIEAAGGPAQDADLAQINRAAKLRDEQQVRVPRLRSERSNVGDPLPPSGAQPNKSDLLDINAAKAEELETLPGIGPVTARKIIAFREENGYFQSVEQLKDAKLVTAATFEKIRPLVGVR